MDKGPPTESLQKILTTDSTDSTDGSQKGLEGGNDSPVIRVIYPRAVAPSLRLGQILKFLHLTGISEDRSAEAR